jgi:hypothetical protein
MTKCGPGSVVGIATGYGLDGPGIESLWWPRFSSLVQTGPGAHPASCTMGTGSFLGVKSGRGVTLTPHPLLVPWSWKIRAIPLLPLWAVRPVQSLSACTRVHFYKHEKCVNAFAECTPMWLPLECLVLDVMWEAYLSKNNLMKFLRFGWPCIVV